MESQKPRDDVRKRALLGTAAAVLAGGLLIALLPDKWHWGSLADSPEARAAHVKEKAGAEIKQRFEEGVRMLNERQYEQALEAFHRVLELSPRMPEAHVNAGYALLGQRRYAIARDFFEGALALNRDQLNAYYGLAEALAGMNDLPGALGAMRTYLHLAPSADPYRARAEAMLKEWEAMREGMRTADAAKAAAARR